MFIDEAVIKIKAGDGGNGCFAYDRMPYQPRGKPGGGNGGRGGHVYIIGDSNLHTLQDAAYQKNYHAQRGMHGKGSRKTGKNGADIELRVPLGTLVYDNETGTLLFDCVKAGEQFIAGRGGRGGRGNASLASPRNPNPQTVEPGRPGEAKQLRLELKVLADVGLVGFPNAGKSTFLSKISKARPKIADYPFTTTVPNLGIVKTQEGHRTFVVADIPGLIEGAHEGRGLGIQFLRHIERTRALAILVESQSPNPKHDADTLLSELEQYSPVLAQKPTCFVLTKSDLIVPERKVKVPRGWLKMSAVTGEGVDKVVGTLERLAFEERDPVVKTGSR